MFLVSTCPYCNTKKVPFIIIGATYANDNNYSVYTCAICQKCYEPTMFLIRQIINDNDMLSIDKTYKLNQNNHENIEGDYTIEKIIRPPANVSYQCPEYVPEDIKTKFDEAAQCHAYDCFCASAAMLRLCLETVTKNLLTAESDKKKSLYNRIDTLFNTKIFSERLHVFAEQIRLDGNTALHEGIINTNDLDALFDFTIFLLEDLYTYRKKMALAVEKQAQRKQ